MEQNKAYCMDYTYNNNKMNLLFFFKSLNKNNGEKKRLLNTERFLFLNEYPLETRKNYLKQEDQCM